MSDDHSVLNCFCISFSPGLSNTKLYSTTSFTLLSLLHSFLLSFFGSFILLSMSQSGLLSLHSFSSYYVRSVSHSCLLSFFRFINLSASVLLSHLHSPYFLCHSLVLALSFASFILTTMSLPRLLAFIYFLHLIFLCVHLSSIRFLHSSSPSLSSFCSLHCCMLFLSPFA